jgi:hypothetical protein
LQFKPGKRFFEAVLNLQGNPEFEAIKQEIQAYHLDAGLHFPRLDGNPLIRLQGATAFALEFLTVVDSAFAHAQLERLKQIKVKGEIKIPF